MLKFKVINWEKQNENISNLSCNEKKFLEEHRGLRDNQTGSTILITDAKEHDIFGQISLIKRELNQLEGEVGNFIPTGLPYQNYIWECSTLELFPSPQRDFYFSLRKNFFLQFYRTLYEGIVAFSIQKEVNFVVVKLKTDVYPSTKDIGFWPYVVEFPPRESRDFFYGLLPLRGRLYENYQTIGENEENE